MNLKYEKCVSSRRRRSRSGCASRAFSVHFPKDEKTDNNDSDDCYYDNDHQNDDIHRNIFVFMVFYGLRFGPVTVNDPIADQNWLTLLECNVIQLYSTVELSAKEEPVIAINERRFDFVSVKCHKRIGFFESFDVCGYLQKSDFVTILKFSNQVLNTTSVLFDHNIHGREAAIKKSIIDRIIHFFG